MTAPGLSQVLHDPTVEPNPPINHPMPGMRQARPAAGTGTGAPSRAGQPRGEFVIFRGSRKHPTKTFHHPPLQRDTLPRHTQLANLAFTRHRLAEFGARIARARLHGAVTVRHGDPDDDRPWPVLHSTETAPAVIEEPFTDADIAELADKLAFLHDHAATTGFDFRLVELASRYWPDLRRELAQAGVAPEPAPTPAENLRHERG